MIMMAELSTRNYQHAEAVAVVVAEANKRRRRGRSKNYRVKYIQQVTEAHSHIPMVKRQKKEEVRKADDIK